MRTNGFKEDFVKLFRLLLIVIIIILVGGFLLGKYVF